MDAHAEDRHETVEQRRYMQIVAELQELARKAPYVTQDWVLQVASMDPADMRRRLICQSDWHGHFAHSLDGIPEIRNLPGAGIDGCRMHKEVRAVVLALLQQIKRLKPPNAGGEATATAPPNPLE
jgi:hypothetical protein